MRFSVITVTLNAEKYLESTLQSVAEQVGVEHEHIIWDGGSQDKTLEIVHSFRHVKLIQGKDQGIADAMNRAAAYACGQFLIFLHADDLLAHPSVLLMVHRILNLHPTVSWLYGKAHIVNEANSFLRTTPFEPFSHRRLRKYNFITHPSTFIASSLFRKVDGYRINFRYCMDYDLWLRLAKWSQPLAVPCILACFREHSNSLSTKEPLCVTDEAYQVRNQYTTTFYERWRSYRTWKKRRNTLLDKTESA